MIDINTEEYKNLLEEFEEGAQNRFRNNDYRSFEEWAEGFIADKEENE